MLEYSSIGVKGCPFGEQKEPFPHAIRNKKQETTPTPTGSREVPALWTT